MNNDNNIPNTNNPTHRFVFTAIGYADATGNVFDKNENVSTIIYFPRILFSNGKKGMR